jgi:hypothetical protein
MDRPLWDVLAALLAALLLAGCASPEAVRPQEGQVVFRAGAASPGADASRVVGGPAIRRLAVVVPAFDPAWEAVWSGGERKRPGGGGAFVGFLAGLTIVQTVPVFLLAWPAAAGVLAGTAALGAFGEQMDIQTHPRLDAGDRSALLEAAATFRPDRLLRASAAEALEARTGRPPLSLPWYPTWGPDTPGTDPLADARRQGADGVLELAVEAFGLAVGEEPDTFGVFVRIRARLAEPANGGHRYERVLEHGPGRPLARLPRPAAYTVEFLALDQARVFRQEMREVIARMARLLAEDPALPLGPP